MIKNTVNSKLKTAIRTAVVTAVWVAVWLFAAFIAEKKHLSILIPYPNEVIEAFRQLLCDQDFYVSCAKSLLRVIEAWGSGLVFGIILAVITKLSKALHSLFAPVLHIIKATPVASFIILALVLMTSSFVPVVTGFLMALPVVWANMSQGLHAPQKEILEMANAFNMSRKNKIRYIYLSSLKPYFSAAATTSMGLTWKACIAAEVICTPKNSIGSEIYNAKVYLETPSLFAWTLTVIVLSVILEKFIKILLKRWE